MARLGARATWSTARSFALSADMVSELRRMDPSPRVGAELGWQRRIRLRGGYASRAGGFGGPSLGVGYDTGNLAIDFARLFDEVSSTEQGRNRRICPYGIGSSGVNGTTEPETNDQSANDVGLTTNDWRGIATEPDQS